MKFRLLVPLIAALLLVSCRKADPEVPEEAPKQPAVVTPTTVPGNTVTAQDTGSVIIEINHVVDGSPLVFGQKYTNPAGDTFTVSRFMYYLSNIVLTRSDNSKLVVPNSYYLVDHAVPGSMKISFRAPAGTYNFGTLLIGVDSLRNTSGLQSGALDPALGMFWNWNTGYIFMKLEGESPQSGSSTGALSYHLGGFTGANKAQRSYSFVLPNVSVTKNGVTRLGFDVNVNEIFKTPLTISFATDYYYMSAGPGAKKMADNYADMLKFTGVK